MQAPFVTDARLLPTGFSYQNVTIGACAVSTKIGTKRDRKARHISSGAIWIGDDASGWTNSPDTINIRYNRLRGRWPYDTAKNGITYYVNTSNLPSGYYSASEAEEAIDDAFDAWDDIATVDLAFIDSTTSTYGWDTDDGKNVILFYDFTQQADLPNNATAIVKQGFPLASNILDDVDILINTNDTWVFQDTTRLRRGVLHEVGHLLGLGDLGGEKDETEHRLMVTVQSRRSAP